MQLLKNGRISGVSVMPERLGRTPRALYVFPAPEDRSTAATRSILRPIVIGRLPSYLSKIVFGNDSSQVFRFCSYYIVYLRYYNCKYHRKSLP